MLDNFEHLADGAAFVGDILAAATAVKLLITSRERLHLQEEWVYEVQELDYPAQDSETEIEGYGAVQLFVHSARRVSPHFRLTKLYKPPVARICRLVGGMPLGIELASAWTRALPCDEIAREIERSLAVMESQLVEGNYPESSTLSIYNGAGGMCMGISSSGRGEADMCTCLEGPGNTHCYR